MLPTIVQAILIQLMYTPICLQLVESAEDDGQRRYNGNYRIDVTECLDGEGDTEWRRLAPLPLPLCSTCGGVYFKQMILVIGGDTTGDAKISDMFNFIPRPLEDLANGSP